MRSLWREWARIRNRLAAQRRVLFLLDFDGTLAPLTRSHSEARLSAEIRSILSALRRREDVRVAILSGRALPDLRSLVGLPSLYYCGNHGLQIEGPGVSFSHPKAVSMRPLIQGLAERLERDLARFPGSVLENKGLTLSVHYRRVPRAGMESLRRLRDALQAETSDLPVRWRDGHKVWEILPGVRWHKGAAGRYLMRRMARSFPVALGDDTTDEDVFAAVRRRGLAIRVGPAGASQADYYLGGQSQVTRFLRGARGALDTKA
jgi:trehalose 6-phosphate phosphatase